MSFIIVGASIAVAAGGAKLGMALSGRKKRIQEQEDAKEQMEARMEEYENLDTSNIYADVKNQYANMENTYEDLTVNQQQAQFQAEQTQQQQANIMQGLQGAAGGSGIAALAQSMAQQGQLAAQQASASIGTQEARIQQLQAGEASRLQQQERAGEVAAQTQRLAGEETARGLEWSKTGTLLGMSQERLGAANQARAQAKAQQMSAVGDIGAAGMQFATAGMKMGGGGGGGGGLSEHTGTDMETNRLFNEGGGANAIFSQTNPGPQSTITWDPNSSDRKLKKNIKKIGKSPSGLNIYSFEFKDSKYGKGVFQGVMSDEVPKKVVIKKDGYNMVDYSKIDVEFKQI